MRIMSWCDFHRREPEIVVILVVSGSTLPLKPPDYYGQIMPFRYLWTHQWWYGDVRRFPYIGTYVRSGTGKGAERGASDAVPLYWDSNKSRVIVTYKCAIPEWSS